MSSTSVLSAAMALCVLGVCPGTSTKSINEEGPTEHCYATDRNPYLGFASKTSYEEVYNRKGIVPPTDCSAKQIWMVIRHGTRYPGEESFTDFEASKALKDEVLANHAKKKGTLCEADLVALRRYDLQLDPQKGYFLSVQGQLDLYNLGQRVRRSFPNIFDDSVYTQEEFQFRNTPTPRTKESAEFFYRGLFGMNFQCDAHPLPEPIENLIYAYNNCPGWETQSAKNKVHRANFIKGEHIRKVVSAVSRRLGFDQDLSFTKLKQIYNDCRFYEAWHVLKRSPWCAAFTKEELLALEYMEDLNYYYKSGPGHPWNLRLSCPLVKDMYDHFSAAAAKNTEGKKEPKAMFYFSHSTMLNQLSAGLGLKEDDEPITEYNYLQKANRKFRTSSIIPFTANIMAVLYKCTSGTHMRLAFYQAEHLVHYPGCSAGICDWEYIKKKFDPYVNDELCLDHSFCNREITKPKSRKELTIQMLKDNSNTIYLSTIAILSAIIVVPMIANGIRTLSGGSR